MTENNYVPKQFGTMCINNAVVVSTPDSETKPGTLLFQVTFMDIPIGIACTGSAATLTVSKGDLVTIHNGIAKPAQRSAFALMLNDISQISVVVVDYGFTDCKDL